MEETENLIQTEEAADQSQPQEASQANTEGQNLTPEQMEEMTKQIETKLEESLKKASMTDAQREEYEFKQRKEALDKRESDLKHRELKSNTTRLLAESGISADIADMVMGEDMKATAQNIKKFKALLDIEVQKQVTQRLKGKIPVAGNAAGDVNSVKTQFLKGLKG